MFARLTSYRAYALLLLVILALRLPGLIFGNVDLDEIEFLLVGRGLQLGWIPYVDIVETKPLLSYLFYAPTALLGFRLWPIQILAILWSFATALLVGRTARIWTDSEQTAACAAWMCGLTSACNVLSVNAEMMANLPLAAALLFLARAERGGGRRHDLCAGLCVGLASLFKHQAGVALLAIAMAIAITALRHHRGLGLARQLAVLVGFSLPWAVVAGLYASLGHWGPFYEWNVLRNILYVGHGAGSTLGRFAAGLGLFVILGAPLLWTFAVQESLAHVAPRGAGGSAGDDPIRRAVVYSVWLTWIPVSLGGRFYGHYYLQFVPPLALLAAPRLAAALSRWRDLRRAVRVAIVLGLALPAAGFLTFAVTRGALRAYPSQDRTTVELSRWLRDHTPRAARLFIWGHFAPIYYLAERFPGTRYKNAALQVGDFDPAHLPEGFDLRPYLSRRDLDATLHDLETRRPDYIVDTAPCNIHSWSKVPLSLFPELERLLATRYELLARPAGCPVYRRR
jgi:hypothetical protein